MEGESKFEFNSSVSFLLETVDCDKLEQYISEIDKEYRNSVIDHLFLELCNNFQLKYEYENFFEYLLL